MRLRDLGTERLTWGDLKAIVRHSPETSALYRSQIPEDERGWTLTNFLLAEVIDALSVSNWQRGSGKRADYPKPYPRPGIEPETTTYGKQAVPIDEMADWLGWTT